MLRDQAKRGQVLIMTEVQAKRFPKTWWLRVWAHCRRRNWKESSSARSDDDDSAVRSVCRPANDPRKRNDKHSIHKSVSEIDAGLTNSTLNFLLFFPSPSILSFLPSSFSVCFLKSSSFLFFFLSS